MVNSCLQDLEGRIFSSYTSLDNVYKKTKKKNKREIEENVEVRSTGGKKEEQMNGDEQ